jgi:hypothetical protein
LIAVGAVLRYAVTTGVEGVDITVIGLILMIVGIVGLVLSLLFTLAWSPWHGRAARGRLVEREPYERPPPY